MNKPTKLSLAIAAAFAGTMAAPLYAQELQRVEVTGSAIKRTIDDEGALPITVITNKELRDAGVTSTEEALQRVAAMQTIQGSSQSIGSGTGGKAEANLRGIGSNKTLVLLNGRRLAAFAFDSQSVDLNAIPFSVIERIEVLRDGASAIYGTDAVGGVINFITKRNFSGIELTAEATAPRGPGADQKRFSVTGGFGDLDKQGFNIWAAYDSRKQDRLRSLDRSFARTGYDPSRGLNLTSGTSYPANFVGWINGTQQGGNPSYPNCAPPSSINDPSRPNVCRYDYTSAIDIIPEQKLDTFALRGNIKLGGDHVYSVEYTRAANSNTARVAPDPVTGLTMTNTSPYYPSSYPGLDTSQPITVGWRMVPAGQRTNEAQTLAERLVMELSGTLGNWDYKQGIFYTKSRAQDNIRDGYVNKAAIQDGITSGILDPFGTPTAEALKLINEAKVFGSPSIGKGSTLGLDFRASRELFSLSGGKASIALGMELRHERYQNDTDDALVTSVPSLGRDPYHVVGSRNVSALTAEVLLPVTKELELQGALRFDRYSDFGNTINPKIGFRYQPFKQFLMRGSYNTGFRAPALDDMYGPQSATYTADAYDDPLLCPNGVVANGGVTVRDCGQQAQVMQGGNPALDPEKSKAFTLGLGFSPSKDANYTIDYWNIKLKNQIDSFPEQAIFGDPAKYADRFVRCNTLSPTQQALYDRCQGGYAGSNAIAYVIALTDNLGGVKTDGFDINATHAFGTGAGRVTLSYSGTYVRNYLYQRIQTDPYIQNVGRYVDASPIFRMQHVFGVDFKVGGVGVNLSVRNKSGYVDQDPSNRVGSYTLTDLGLNYSPIKGLTLAGGIKNLFDVDPPFSNQGTTFQKGYDPRFTDPTGRAFWFRLQYAYK